MLLEFSVANFLSFSEETRFDLRVNQDWVTKNPRAIEPHLKADFEVGAVPSEEQTKLLRCVALYGANASGKSNLIKALSFMDKCILRAGDFLTKGDLLEDKCIPFLLDDEAQTKDSLFEVMIVVDGHCYQYGFCCNKKAFTQEWLYRDGNEKAIFKRVGDQYEFSDEFKKSVTEETFTSWYEQMDSATLFLSVAAVFSNETSGRLTKPVYLWFKDTLRTHDSTGDGNEKLRPFTLGEFDKKPEIREQIKKLVRVSDLSIVDIEVKKVDIPEKMFSQIKEHIPEVLLAKIESGDIFGLFFNHQNKKGNLVPMSPNQVSTGTNALFNLAGPFFDVLLNNRVLFIDEIDNSLHPLLLRHLIDLFHEQAARMGSKSQLIFTTHDTSLMRKLTPDSFSPNDQRKFVLRLDQIFGLYKNMESASEIKKIIDREDVCDLLEKPEGLDFHYLEGWFGAVPTIDYSELSQKQEEVSDGKSAK